MKDLKQFIIPFLGLKLGSHNFQYQIDNKFFEYFDFYEFDASKLTIDVVLEKKPTFLKLTFNLKGKVNVLCDVSLEPFDLKIKDNFSLLVKFGEEFNDENEEILIIPNHEYQINIAQYIYELVVLSLPSRKIHPKVLDGTLETDAIKKLKELEINKVKIVENSSADPRWDKLKDLITEKKT